MFVNNKHFVLIILFAFFSALSVKSQIGSADFVHQYSITDELKAPSRLAVDNSGNICVADAGSNQILKYGPSGNYLGVIPFNGFPLSLAFSDNGRLFIGDDKNSKITRLDPDGSNTIIYSAPVFPSDMVAGPDNLLYVVDAISKTVLVMDFSGNIVRSIGSGILLSPRCIAYDRQNKRIIVSEHGGVGTGTNLHAEIRIFELTGNLVSTFGGYGNTDGKFYRIQGLAIGKCGNIYASDAYQGMVSVFNKNGVFITKFGQYGTLPADFNVPMDIDFDQSQNLWVSSMNNGSLEVFSITDQLPSSKIMDKSYEICNGVSAEIPVNFVGTAPWTFTYTINGINPSTVAATYNNPYIINTTVPGSYNIIAVSDATTDGSCYSGTADVIINPAPTASISTGNLAICSGSSVNIPVNFTGNKPFSFTYFINGNNPVTINNIFSDNYTIHATEAGIYTLAAVSGAGCIGTDISGSATVSINESPTANISNISATVCSGQNANIPIHLTGTAPWSFTYSLNGQNQVIVNNIMDSNYLINSGLAGSYQMISVSDGICTSGSVSGYADITLKPLPSASIASGNANICNGEISNIKVELTGSGPWNLSFSNGEFNSINIDGVSENPFFLPVSEAGNYQLTSVSESGCDGSITPGNAIITVNQLPDILFSGDNIISKCDGNLAILDAGGPFPDYLWSDFSINQTLSVNYTGAYSVTVTDNNGCKNNATAEVTSYPAPLPAFNFTENSLNVNFTNTSLNSDTYFWNFGDGQSSNLENPTHHYNNEGIYYISLTASNSFCTEVIAYDTIIILITGINKSVEENIFSMFPNPTTGVVNILLKNHDHDFSEINLFNVTGQLVFYEQINKSLVNMQIDLSDLPGGVYTVRFSSKNNIEEGKLILIR
jgi:PKD repeat protein